MPAPSRRPVRLLHRLDGLLAQAVLAGRGSGSAARRQRQRLALAQRLLDPLPPALLSPDRQGQRFWQALRWGGLGLLLAWLLRP